MEVEFRGESLNRPMSANCFHILTVVVDIRNFRTHIFWLGIKSSDHKMFAVVRQPKALQALSDLPNHTGHN